MEKTIDKQAVIDAYLLGKKRYRELEKQYGVSRPTINRWVLDYQGIAQCRPVTYVGAGGSKI